MRFRTHLSGIVNYIRSHRGWHFASSRHMAKQSVLITTSQDAALHLRKLISYEVEELWILALASNCTLLRKQCLFRGTVDECLVHPREIFRFAVLARASSLVLAHSHPSGECFPSEADVSFTQRILKASELFQIPVVDHLILTRTAHFSFSDRLWL